MRRSRSSVVGRIVKAKENTKLTRGNEQCVFACGLCTVPVVLIPTVRVGRDPGAVAQSKRRADGAATNR